MFRLKNDKEPSEQKEKNEGAEVNAANNALFAGGTSSDMDLPPPHIFVRQRSMNGRRNIFPSIVNSTLACPGTFFLLRRTTSAAVLKTL